ncbi:3'-5' exonuclease [Cellulophaga baltica]|uniref:3'-5' exonuclease n=1 Tax=Cellulophaga TaxID=104264 RepID=UPI001C077F6F|nr:MULTISPECIES: 3'-5' exonuclease [Cellulophaga]MBU2996416.1 3'-5' exonuclease [Cellulophaga baltica]MDO6767812.1 3'-5' exonuclease [Cellulophaga sp. 1_MG-2023]
MIDSFVAIDFETAMAHHICSVGIVTFEDGKVVDEYHQLIKPPNNRYNWRTIEVHGITEEDTLYAPEFKVIYPEIKKRLYGKHVVAHNEVFDRNVLTKSMRDNTIDYSDLKLTARWHCTYKTFKSMGYKPANLDACCKKHNIELEHHQALSDARACGKLFLISENRLLF